MVWMPFKESRKENPYMGDVGDNRIVRRGYYCSNCHAYEFADEVHTSFRCGCCGEVREDYYIGDLLELEQGYFDYETRRVVIKEGV